ncbi:MAG TPA: LptF/LptG family permease [Gemmataceae bacterium]|nr:LptF/LptG family permease [Gemmataceae bacterium]
MTILDRMLFASFLRAFLICLTSTLSLYIVVDLFTNLDDFANQSGSFVETIKHVAVYYGYRSIQYVDRLAEAIVLLAAMFTISWMQRSNELLPLLSAGVSTKRVLRPILFGSCLLLGLSTLNSELVIPEVADMLLLDRDDPDGGRDKLVQGAYDSNGVHVEGIIGFPKELTVKGFYVTVPETATNGMVHLSAADAMYIPPREGDSRSGGWLMTTTTPAELDPANKPEMLELIDPGKYFLKVREVDFKALTRNPKWFMYASTVHLHELLDRPDGGRQSQIAVLFHMRLTRPIIGLLLVIMGLSIILRDQTRHVLISAGLCLVMCAVFYGVVLACRFLGNADLLPPALAAWLPVLIFGPLAFVLYDAIHT